MRRFIDIKLCVRDVAPSFRVGTESQLAASEKIAIKDTSVYVQTSSGSCSEKR